jgi:FKBP-type peptidyl-prolyl cis-trans isomerase SlyD
MSEDLKVQNGQVVSMDYTLTVDGEILDSSEEQEPLDFLQGAGNIIPGLERELYGMAVGESKSVVVIPADGYGEYSDEAFVDVPRDQFPKSMKLKVGDEIQVTDQDGEIAIARIDNIEGQIVRLDFNHPLAGKELHFDVTIVSLREASEEEKEHGHVHYEGGHDDDYDDDFEDEEEDEE